KLSEYERTNSPEHVEERAKQLAEERLRDHEARRQQEEHRETFENYERGLHEAVSQQKDFAELAAQAQKISVPGRILAAIQAALVEEGPSVGALYIHLLRNPRLSEKFGSMSPERVYREVIRIGASIEPKPGPVTNAPPPIRPIGGPARGGQPNPASLTLSE